MTFPVRNFHVAANPARPPPTTMALCFVMDFLRLNWVIWMILKNLLLEIYQIADSEYNATGSKKTMMLKTLTLNCALGVRARPQVIQNVLIPFAKWKVAPKIPRR